MSGVGSTGFYLNTWEAEAVDVCFQSQPALQSGFEDSEAVKERKKKAFLKPTVLALCLTTTLAKQHYWILLGFAMKGIYY